MPARRCLGEEGLERQIKMLPAGKAREEKALPSLEVSPPKAKLVLSLLDHIASLKKQIVTPPKLRRPGRDVPPEPPGV